MGQKQDPRQPATGPESPAGPRKGPAPGPSGQGPFESKRIAISINVKGTREGAGTASGMTVKQLILFDLDAKRLGC
jgi:hypothetical protein